MHRLASLTSTGLGTVEYGYDDYGKLTTITRGSTTYSLTYDAWNRPISTKVGTTALSTNTYDSDFRLSTVTYANGGALGACLETISYGYDAAHQDWADQLTSYNGEAIRYDDSGNPISYRGYTMAWQGKRLTSAAKTGTAVSYSYDKNGIRTQKTVNGVATNYYYNGSLLISMTQGTDTLLFSYDASGSVVSVNFNSTDYYYVRNGQGDVVKLIDGSGTTVTEYTYDTWGKLLSCTGSLSATLGTLNPFRYRGYVYDTETGFYYLQSRYYDPEVCRFLSADVLLSTGQGVLGHNTYAYCLNNPVNMIDLGGKMPCWLIIVVVCVSLDCLIRLALSNLTYCIIPKDEQGKFILKHWINGGGEEVIIEDDPEWTNYLLENEQFMNYINYFVKNAIDTGQKRIELVKEHLSLTESGKGGYYTGYEYLNGSESNVGGFCLDVTVTHLDGNRYLVEGSFSFNDRIDPNQDYRSDVYIIAVLRTSILNVWQGRNYDMHISGSFSYIYEYNP